ncbi:MAG: hypothetical protein CVV64_17025 [Candidatus Wallbacteria bacterium HGW-Wallbacteria-1]|jgi:hypothetical protein|uniref:Uncharacterized protein n=1 Tax=Candidatus Wallbacteria bacterium HGW-Wallbacteria-1 TaxID=2013854 RepID=A0A2N1PKJ2_9BACT|nr:MAG: hypothetical protein CVV64_17025 [Candidatus Wallbacteria bacterium HGW-Wallbacteria-1]
MTSLEKLDQLIHATLGELTPGITHEINNPLQFIAGNIHYLNEHFKKISELMEGLQQILGTNDKKASRSETTISAADMEKLKKLFSATDPDFSLTEIPLSLQECFEGINRISDITDAVRKISTGRESDDCNVNELVSACMILIQNKLKYAARVTLSLCPQNPVINCFRNQIFLVIMIILKKSLSNLLTIKKNSQHGWLGEIILSVAIEDNKVNITISDNAIVQSWHDKTNENLNLLSEMENIIEEHNGEIIMTENSDGSIYRLFFPLK